MLPPLPARPSTSRSVLRAAKPIFSSESLSEYFTQADPTMCSERDSLCFPHHAMRRCFLASALLLLTKQGFSLPHVSMLYRHRNPPTHSLTSCLYPILLQTLVYNDELTLCDCPGLVFPTILASKAELVSRPTHTRAKEHTHTDSTFPHICLFFTLALCMRLCNWSYDIYWKYQ